MIAEGGSVPSGVGYGEGCPFSSRLKGLGSVVISPAGSGAEPRPKTDFGVFSRPQNAPFCTYMTKKIWGGQFTLASPMPNSGDLSAAFLRDLRPWFFCRNLSDCLSVKRVHSDKRSPEPLTVFKAIRQRPPAFCWCFLCNMYVTCKFARGRHKRVSPQNSPQRDCSETVKLYAAAFYVQLT